MHSGGRFVKPGSACNPLNSPLSGIPTDSADHLFEDREIDVSAANNGDYLLAAHLSLLLYLAANV